MAFAVLKSDNTLADFNSDDNLLSNVSWRGDIKTNRLVQTIGKDMDYCADIKHLSSVLGQDGRANLRRCHGKGL